MITTAMASWGMVMLGCKQAAHVGRADDDVAVGILEKLPARV